MNKEFIENATTWIVEKLRDEGISLKTLDEGIFSVEPLWGDIIKYTESRGIDPDILSEFQKTDELLMKEIKETILKFVKRELVKGIELKLEQDKAEEKEVSSWD